MGNHRKPVNAPKLADFQFFFNHQRLRVSSKMERVKGIEPSSLAWEAKALPLSYTRMSATADSAPLPLSAARVNPLLAAAL